MQTRRGRNLTPVFDLAKGGDAVGNQRLDLCEEGLQLRAGAISST